MRHKEFFRERVATFPFYKTSFSAKMVQRIFFFVALPSPNIKFQTIGPEKEELLFP